MKYVDRNISDEITGVYERQQYEGQEPIEEAHKDYIAFETRREALESEMVIKAKLAEIDFKSIRSIREWLVSQPDAPQQIKDLEAQAQTERSKL